jgi:hypothetical protein
MSCSDWSRSVTGASGKSREAGAASCRPETRGGVSTPGGFRERRGREKGRRVAENKQFYRGQGGRRSTANRRRAPHAAATLPPPTSTQQNFTSKINCFLSLSESQLHLNHNHLLLQQKPFALNDSRTRRQGPLPTSKGPFKIPSAI